VPSIAFKLSVKDRKVLPLIKQAIGRELYRFGEEVMTASKQVVPVKTGALMNTGKVEFPVESGKEISLTLGYGSESVGYAVYVHENLNAVNWTRPGSGPKYLEAPLHERQDKLGERIAQAIEAAIKAAP